MNRIIRTIAFILMLAGLLAWGISSMAHGPSVSTISRDATELHGRVVEDMHPVSRDQIRTVGR